MPYSDSVSNCCKHGLDKCFKCSVNGELSASQISKCSVLVGMPVQDDGAHAYVGLNALVFLKHFSVTGLCWLVSESECE